MPAFLLPLVVAVVAIALIVVLLPLLKKKDTVTLSATKGAVTTVAPDPSVDDAAAAAAETAVADPVDPTAGKQPFKFADPTTPAAAGSPAPASQGGTNGTAVASPAPTTPPTSAAPGASPTTVQATTTTAAPTTTTTQTTADVYYEAKQEDAGQAHYVFVGGGTVGQTFKATQPVITEAWLNLSGDKVTFNLRKTGPGGQVVGTVANVQIVSFAFTKVTFNPPISVTNGATYYLEGVGVGAQDMYAWFSNANDYAFGDGWFNGAAQGNDLNARVIGRTS
jgi:hypothetical protein